MPGALPRVFAAVWACTPLSRALHRENGRRLAITAVSGGNITGDFWDYAAPRTPLTNSRDRNYRRITFRGAYFYFSRRNWGNRICNERRERSDRFRNRAERVLSFSRFYTSKRRATTIAYRARCIDWFISRARNTRSQIHRAAKPHAAADNFWRRSIWPPTHSTYSPCKPDCSQSQPCSHPCTPQAPSSSPESCCANASTHSKVRRRTSTHRGSAHRTMIPI